MFKIIKKIGNINSIKLGAWLLLISAILITFCKSYYLILLGHIIYDLAFVFKNMENVILRKNLKYQNKVDEYLKVQSKSSLIYSFLTMVIAFAAGFIFNINNYLPMILCILFCILNIVLANFLYEFNEKVEKVNISEKKFKMTNIIFFILLLYAFLYATIDLGQSNNKLFMQYKLSTYLNIDSVAIVLSFIIAISRVVRFLSNLLFIKFFSRNKENILLNIGYSLSISFAIIIIGSILKSNILGIILMALGFFVFLGVRDPFANYMKTLLLNNCDEQSHERAITYLTIARKLGKFLISSLITLILLKVEMIYVMILLLLVSIINIYIIKKIYKFTE